VITGRLDEIEKLLDQTRHRLGTAEEKIESMTPLQCEMAAVQERMKRLEERFKQIESRRDANGYVPSQTTGYKMPHRDRS
jgi:hypothetical protein